MQSVMEDRMSLPKNDVPSMSMADILGYRSNAVRREVVRFPVLATQVRCSTGFTVVPRGRLEVLKADRAGAAPRSRRVF